MYNTVKILSFRTDWSGQIVQTQINTVYIFWMHYSLVKPRFSSSRMITAKFSSVQKFRTFTVYDLKCEFAKLVTSIFFPGEERNRWCAFYLVLKFQNTCCACQFLPTREYCLTDLRSPFWIPKWSFYVTLAI